MAEESFGKYFRAIRTSQNLTQEKVAEIVGRKKMTISLIEQEKNNSPSGKLLTDMINSLSLTDEDIINRLYLLASKSRGLVPDDIMDYFYSNEEIYGAIKRGMNQKQDNRKWKEIFK